MAATLIVKKSNSFALTGRLLLLMMLILFPDAIFSQHLTPSMGEHDAQCGGNGTVKDTWGPSMASRSQAFLVRLQRIVKADDKVQFASVVRYPLRVYTDSRRFEVSSPSELVRQYRNIVTPMVKHAILTQTGECLFGNYQGMMIGNGDVWFEPEERGGMKIITINLNNFSSESSKQPAGHSTK